MNIDREYAMILLNEANKLNCGRWFEHSLNVAKCAEIIAKNTEYLDSEKAFVLGLLHDIGRRFGFSHIKHVYDGMIFLDEKNFYEGARICLTHSFPIQTIYCYNGKLDLPKEKLDFLENKLKEIIYDDYDRLIQLCDALGAAEGFVRLEIRLFDVAIRNGINEYTIEKWKKFLELKRYFDEKCNNDIYKLLNIE